MVNSAAALFSAAIILTAAVSAQAPVQSQFSQNVNFATLENPISSAGQQTTTTVVIKPAGSCPVVMSARQGSLTALVRTGRQPLTPQQYDLMPRPVQRIHLILSGFRKDKRVNSALITANGLSARSRMQNLNLTGEQHSDIRRTLQVAFTPDQDGSVSADIDLPAFTSVQSLQLKSITYSDGSSWTIETTNACVVQPDPLMLIAGQ